MQTCLQNAVGCWCWYLAVSLSCHREDALWKARGFLQLSRLLGQWKKHEVSLEFIFLKYERCFCANLKQVSLSRTQICVNNRIRMLTSIEARVGFAFMSYCSAQVSACLEILAIWNEKLPFLGKGKYGLSRGNEGWFLNSNPEEEKRGCWEKRWHSLHRV